MQLRVDKVPRALCFCLRLLTVSHSCFMAIRPGFYRVLLLPSPVFKGNVRDFTIDGVLQLQGKGTDLRGKLS